jgi:hypothetical protein
MSKKSTWGYAKDFVEDVIEESTEDSPDNFAGRDINQDNSEKNTEIENFTQRGDIIEGDKNTTIIDTDNCKPESISMEEVDAPFWDNDIKTIDIKCKEDDQPEAQAKPETELETIPEPEYEPDDAPLLESQDLGSETLPEPEPEFEFEWGG